MVMVLRPFVVVEARARGWRLLLSGETLALVALALHQEVVALQLWAMHWAAASVGETSQLGLALVWFLLGAQGHLCKTRC